MPFSSTSLYSKFSAPNGNKVRKGNSRMTEHMVIIVKNLQLKDNE